MFCTLLGKIDEAHYGHPGCRILTLITADYPCRSAPSQSGKQYVNNAFCFSSILNTFSLELLHFVFFVTVLTNTCNYLLQLMLQNEDKI